MNKNQISWRDLSDTTIAERVAKYIKHHRLQSNQTQAELAASAGVGLRTLKGIEVGSVNMTLRTLIQLLRALNSLTVIEGFEIKEQISPLLLAKQELQKKRIRVRAKKSDKKPPSNW